MEGRSVVAEGAPVTGRTTDLRGLSSNAVIFVFLFAGVVCHTGQPSN